MGGRRFSSAQPGGLPRRRLRVPAISCRPRRALERRGGSGTSFPGVASTVGREKSLWRGRDPAGPSKRGIPLPASTPLAAPQAEARVPGPRVREAGRGVPGAAERSNSSARPSREDSVPGVAASCAEASALEPARLVTGAIRVHPRPARRWTSTSLALRSLGGTARRPPGEGVITRFPGGLALPRDSAFLSSAPHLKAGTKRCLRQGSTYTSFSSDLEKCHRRGGGGSSL